MVFKKIFLSVLFSVFLLNNIHSQTRNFDGETQTEMNLNAGNVYSEWNKKMQKTLLAAINQNKEDKLFVANLNKSQKIWEAWRDAEIETFYPIYEDKSFYGTIQPLCYFSKLIDWTEQRIQQLEIYSKGVEEDDACSPGKM